VHELPLVEPPWQCHGAKNDTGSCMLRYHFRRHVPDAHATHRQASEHCDFYGQGGEPPRDYVQEFKAQIAAASLLDRIMVERV
jgi:hypothetical protein